MISHGPEGTVQVFWHRSRFWLLVVSNPLWIALTAPARWLLDRASRFGHRAGVALRPPGCGSHGGRNQACQAVQWRWQNRAPSRSLRACSARPCADRAAERTAKSYGSSAAEAADAAAVVGATSGQADRTARRSGPQYGRERRRDNAPVPPICTFKGLNRLMAVATQISQLWMPFRVVEGSGLSPGGAGLGDQHKGGCHRAGRRSAGSFQRAGAAGPWSLLLTALRRCRRRSARSPGGPARAGQAPASRGNR